MIVPEVDALDSGSDHTAFISHAGITAAQLGIIHPTRPYYSMYHSVYDSFTWMSNWGDPTFEYHAMMSQVWGTLALNIASDMVRAGVCAHVCITFVCACACVCMSFS